MLHIRSSPRGVTLVFGVPPSWAQVVSVLPSIKAKNILHNSSRVLSHWEGVMFSCSTALECRLSSNSQIILISSSFLFSC